MKMLLAGAGIAIMLINLAGGAGRADAAEAEGGCETLWDSWKFTEGGGQLPGHGTDIPDGWYQFVGFAGQTPSHLHESGLFTKAHRYSWGRSHVPC